MSDNEWTADSIFELFGDDIARAILILASHAPVSADELARQLDVSPPTIYRRLSALSAYDLVTEELSISRTGHHYRTFETTFEQISFELDAGEFALDVAVRESLADRFESFWSELERSSPTVDLGSMSEQKQRQKHDRYRGERTDG